MCRGTGQGLCQKVGCRPVGTIIHGLVCLKVGGNQKSETQLCQKVGVVSENRVSMGQDAKCQTMEQCGSNGGRWFVGCDTKLGSMFRPLTLLHMNTQSHPHLDIHMCNHTYSDRPYPHASGQTSAHSHSHTHMGIHNHTHTYTYAHAQSNPYSWAHKYTHSQTHTYMGTQVHMHAQ